MKQSYLTPFRGRRAVAGLATLLAVLIAFAGTPAALDADDRDLFRSEAAAPYIFVLFDATGSMADNLASRDTALEDDDPTSKLFLAKEALYAVLEDVEGVNFGFATFPDQDRHYVDFKSYNPTAYVADANGSDRDSNCSGWEPNDDRWQDRSEGYTYKWSNTTNARGLQVGDIVPLDWGDNNVERIRRRLAPNLALGESTPDFGIARYFRDRDTSGTDYRALRDGRARPFIARGLTPLAGALNSFRGWYQDWRRLAEANDPSFDAGCREVFVLLMTDGFETCGGNGVQAATDLLGDGVRTYVVGFAVNNPALDSIAAAGGTNNAFFANDQAQLVAAFNQILVDIQTQSRTFASAAVPSVVGTASDLLYLTSFGPVADSSSLWPGRLDAWVKPLTTALVGGQQVPNRNLTCAEPDDRGCVAWDAAEVLKTQAPTAGEAAAGTYMVGDAESERRVYWSRSQVANVVPLEREYFVPPADDPTRQDLYGPAGMGLNPADANFNTNGVNVIAETLRRKFATIANPMNPDQLINQEFVLGDIFHSDPAVLREPRRSDYFALDLAEQLTPCDPDNVDLSRYPCFARTHLFRRRVLFAGSNDGQLHAFDAGVPVRNEETGLVEYTSGTGGELFAFIPRAVLPAVRRMANGGGQEFTVDGPVAIDDVKMNTGFGANEVEWRTILIGGLREGGSAYYALDVTQPDELLDDDEDSEGNVAALGLPNHRQSIVPGCTVPGADDALDPRDCGGVPYPAVRWEFTDTWDEDNNGKPDLGNTWSKVNTGRVRLADNAEAFVAIFGGGLDPDFEQQPLDEFDDYRSAAGNYLYMIDIATGQPIYKRRIDVFPDYGISLCASLSSRDCVEPGYVASEPAAVDTDRDGYLDTVYIGTSSGFLVKVDISSPVAVDTVTVDDWSSIDPDTGSPPLARTVDRIVDTAWDPYPIFSTGGRPIFFPPSVVFVNQLQQYALAFGTGDRFDITRETAEAARFYAFLDPEIASTDPDLPYDVSALIPVDRNPAGTPDPSANFLVGGGLAGWVVNLEPNERVLNKSFTLAGLLTFSTFIPSSPDAVLGVDDTCADSGVSRLYAALLTNGSPLHGNDMVLSQLNDFVTQPFVTSGDASNDMGSDSYDPDGTGPPGATGCDEGLSESVKNALLQFYPEECTFSNFTLDVEALLSQNGVECIVGVPVCVIERNWKEF